MSKKIKLDPNNFNKHTEKGMQLLEDSIDEVGVIESITVDKNGEIITGNARKEIFDKKGLSPVFIKLQSDEYPVIETNLEGELRVKAALYANTVGKHNLNFDTNLIEEIAVEEFGINVEEIGIEAPPFDMLPDYSGKNKEFNSDQFDKEVQLRMKFDSETYLLVIDRLANVGEQTHEAALLKLLEVYEQQA